MPIYEYRCEECGHEHEALQKLNDPLLKDCPACGQAALKKKVSAAGFRLKGGGWYETDFKSGNKKNLIGDKSGDSAKTEGDGAKQDSKKEAANDSAGNKEASKSASTGTATTTPAKPTSADK